MDSDSTVLSGATTVPTTINEVRSKFATWRAAKRHNNSPTPDELWNAALSLRDRYSICAIAKALRLNPTLLAEQSRRRESGDERFAITPSMPGHPMATAENEATFVEIACPISSAVHPPSAAPFIPRQILEIRFPDGTQVSAIQAAPVDVVPLFRALLADRR